MGWASMRRSREGGRDAIFDRFLRASPIQCDCCPRSPLVLSLSVLFVPQPRVREEEDSLFETRPGWRGGQCPETPPHALWQTAGGGLLGARASHKVLALRPPFAPCGLRACLESMPCSCARHSPLECVFPAAASGGRRQGAALWRAGCRCCRAARTRCMCTANDVPGLAPRNPQPTRVFARPRAGRAWRARAALHR
jgi:hypothetical protein